MPLIISHMFESSDRQGLCTGCGVPVGDMCFVSITDIGDRLYCYKCGQEIRDMRDTVRNAKEEQIKDGGEAHFNT